MNARHSILAVALITAFGSVPTESRGQAGEAQTVNAAIEVFQGFTAFRAQSIPQSMLADAQAVAIIPNVVKGGFVIAGRFGRGVLLVREPNGVWRAPVFVTFTGGSVGWQVGLQSSDVVLVFKNRKGVESMLSGSEFTLGADASIAAGPVGRQASAGTDVKLNAEIYSYSRSRGLFAGVSLDGSVLKVDNNAAALFYGPSGVVPPQAAQLVELVAKTTVGGPENPAMVDAAAAGAPVGGATPEQVRAALVASSRQLDPLLDENWKKYLALPPQVLAGQPPVRSDLVATVARYDQIVQDAQYKALTDRPEFRNTRDLLHRFLTASDAAEAAATASNGLGALPPPPGTVPAPVLPSPQ
ncbi:MAG TPA: lipid-binding SYLF domain-containing protein [Pirellulales bacterium]|jgi:lipid-binding SYLF domain-containing protein